MAAVVKHSERSQTVLLQRIAAALLPAGPVVKYPSQSKTVLLQVIGGRLTQ